MSKGKMKSENTVLELSLKKQGEGRVKRQCPLCGSKKGRVGCGPDPNGKAARRGWLCFSCGYFGPSSQLEKS